MKIITDRLNDKIKIGKREKNYVWYYTNPEFLEDLQNQNFNFISIEANFYVYIVPLKSNSYRDKFLFQICWSGKTFLHNNPKRSDPNCNPLFYS